MCSSVHAERSDLGVRVWMDLSDDEKASFYFANIAGEHFLVRSPALPDGLTPLALKQSVKCSSFSVRALLEDARVGCLAGNRRALGARNPPAGKVIAAATGRARTPKAPTTPSDQSALGPKISTVRGSFRAKLSLVPRTWPRTHVDHRELGTTHCRLGEGPVRPPQELVTPEVSVEWTTVATRAAWGSTSTSRVEFFRRSTPRCGAEITSFRRALVRRTGSRARAVQSLSVPVGASLSRQACRSVPPRRFRATVRGLSDSRSLRLGRSRGRKEMLVSYWVRPGLNSAATALMTA